MSDQEPIKGKVARVLNARQLVLNIGREHGVELGMRFDVLDPKGEDITDPESHKVLGSVRLPKVRLEVTLVEDLFSVVSTYRSWKRSVGGAFADYYSQLLLPQEWRTQFETLKRSPDTYEALDEKDSYVKTGDPVVQVTIPDEAAAKIPRKGLG
jgi:hypothetical protein